MKSFFISFVLLISFQALASHEYNLTKSGVILEGYDVVSYFQGTEPKKGKPQFQTQVGEVTYWFADEENKKTFLKDPKKYEPAFGGWCAYAVADSKDKVEVDPKSYVLQDGRLLVFYDGLFGDTRKKWTTNKSKTPAAYLKDADTNWTQIKTKAP